MSTMDKAELRRQIARENTEVYSVQSVKYNTLLGVIEWNGNDYCYSFTAAFAATLSPAILRVIFEKVNELNAEHFKNKS